MNGEKIFSYLDSSCPSISTQEPPTSTSASELPQRNNQSDIYLTNIPSSYPNSISRWRSSDLGISRHLGSQSPSPEISPNAEPCNLGPTRLTPGASSGARLSDHSRTLHRSYNRENIPIAMSEFRNSPRSR